MTATRNEGCSDEDALWWPRALARHRELLKDIGPEFEDYAPVLLAIAEAEGRDFPHIRRALAGSEKQSP
jgi:hypothetical protein